MSSHSSPEADFGLLFALAFRGYVDHLHAELARRGFTPVRSAFGPILRALRGRETTLTALAADLGVSKQAAGRVIDDMRAAGFVSQRPDAADGRARILTLSTRGLAMVDAAIEIGTAFEARVARDIGPGAAHSLRDALGHVVERTGAAGDLAARRVRSM